MDFVDTMLKPRGLEPCMARLPFLALMFAQNLGAGLIAIPLVVLGVLFSRIGGIAALMSIFCFVLLACLLVLSLWIAIVLTAKRLRDINMSAWFSGGLVALAFATAILQHMHDPLCLLLSALGTLVQLGFAFTLLVVPGHEDSETLDEIFS